MEVDSQLKDLRVRTGYLRRPVGSHAGLTWYTRQRERERGWRSGWLGQLGVAHLLGNVLTVLVALKTSFSHAQCNCFCFTNFS